MTIFLRCMKVAAVLLLTTAQTFAEPTVPTSPPIARIEPVVDIYFGEKVTDPYRWMENEKDRDWLPFLRAQNAYTRAVLDKLPGREELLERIQQLSGDIATPSKLQLAGGRVFFQQRPAGANNYKLFFAYFI